jgi:DNA-binding NarL/FixJ family response regulator
LGASGFLLKQASSDNLATAIREVQKGNTFFSSAISKRLLGHTQKSFRRGGHVAKKTNRLSSREVEVLQLIAEGKPNKLVAAELGVSFKTVDKHRQHLMTKLDLHDVAALTRYAIAEGIIESNVRLTIS